MSMKKAMLKVGKETVVNTVDNISGEILETVVQQHKYLSDSKEQFFIGYVSMLAVFNELSGNAIKVYAYLLENYVCGIGIGITSSIKEEIKERIKSKAKGVTTIDNALKELVEVKFLIKSGHGTYIINPRYAFKGSTMDRNKSLKAVIELECPDC